MFIAGDLPRIDQAVRSDAGLARTLAAHVWSAGPIYEGKVRSTTDNWPYLYLEQPGIPTLFIALGGILFFLWLQSSREVFGTASLRAFSRADQLPFVAMGAGFSFFQVFGVNQGAILFGSSWIVNAVVISSMLCVILGANLLWQSFPRPNLVRVLFLGMSAVLGGMYFIDFSSFLSLSAQGKSLVIFFFIGGPMLLSGYNFACMFEAAPDKSRALGANLFGALIGGALQLSTFLMGIKSLLLLASTAYVFAALVHKKASVGQESQRLSLADAA